MQKNDIDQLFADELSNHQSIPPAAVWENIQKELSGQARKKRRQKNWLRLIAACSLLMITIGGLTWKLTEQKPSSRNSWSGLSTENSKPLAEKQPQANPTGPRSVHPVIPSSKQSLTKENSSKVALVAPNTQMPTSKSSIERPLQMSEGKQTELRPAALHIARISPLKLKEMRPEAGDLDIHQHISILRPAANMLAASSIQLEPGPIEQSEKENILVNVLNGLSKRLLPEGRELDFSQDEEGTLKIKI